MNENLNIVDINETDFNDKVIEASGDKLIIVDFWAPWCGPCKQLTPILEKVVKTSNDKVILAKINIDENQQIAAQLRIQSIPTVYAFKDKQIVNAFQGIIPEKQIIEFIEKCLGSKLNEDFNEFYNEIVSYINEGKHHEAKDKLLEFYASNPKEIKAIGLYLDCLIELKEFDNIGDFINSLENETKEHEEIKKVLKKLDIIKSNAEGPNIDQMLKKLDDDPGNIDLIIDISTKYFSEQNYENSFRILLENYPKNKDKVKKKMVEFFNVLGNDNEHTVNYRKKLSQIMFS